MTQEIFDSIYRLKLPEKVWKRAKDSLFEDYRQEMYRQWVDEIEEKVTPGLNLRYLYDKDFKDWALSLVAGVLFLPGAVG